MNAEIAEESQLSATEQARRAFENVDAILDGDTGWASEEEMIADLAEFRRQREAERSSHGGEQNRTH